ANFTIDSTGPSTPVLVAPPNGSTTTETQPIFTWEASTDNLTGIGSYEINIDGSLITQGATTTYTPPSAMSYGAHTWRVRARDRAGNWGTPAAAWTFNITSEAGRPSVEVYIPNGGEEWMGGSTYNITWYATDESGIDSISIYYTTGEGWVQIAIGQINDGDYLWPVPTLNTSEARVRIEAFDSTPQHLVGTDESDANFTIDSTGPSTPVLVAPLNTSSTTETQPTLTWEASTDNLTGIASYEVNLDGTLITQDATTSYTPPSALSYGVHTWRVRARDGAGNWGTPAAAWTFNVTTEAGSPSVEVYVPNGGEQWMGGSTQNITWYATDESGIDEIRIYYTTGEGWVQIAIGQINDGDYLWPVPTLNTSEARVRIEAIDSTPQHLVGTDESDAVFTIDSTGPSAPNLTAPPNGSSTTETTPTLVWQASTDNLTGVGSYEITLDNIVTTQGATTTYTPPSALSYGTHSWEVRARDRVGNWGSSSAIWSFSVTTEAARPSVEVIVPNGGEEWMGGSSQNITWTATDESGIDEIRIYYTTGEGWVQIAIGQINDGDYLWPVPTLNTSEARVRIEAIDSTPQHLVGTDESDANFTIDSTGPSAPNLTAPPNTSSTTETTPTFSWQPAVDNLTGIGSYEITIDVTVTTQGATTNYTPSVALSMGLHTWEVRARDRVGNWGTASASWTFTITTESNVPSVEVIVPNGGEQWQGNSVHNITWTASDESGISEIRIYYTTGEGWVTIITGIGNTGSYPWTTPLINTAEARVRVEAIDGSPSHNVASDESDANFTIDSTGPSAPVLTTPANSSTTTETTPTFTWQASIDNLTGVGSYEITIDVTVTTQGATTNYTPPVALTVGIHTWEVRARDGVGNWGAASVSFSFTIEAVGSAPILHDGTTDNVLPTPAQATDGSGNVTFTFRIRDAEANNCSAINGSFFYQVNTGGWNAIVDTDITGTKTGLSSATNMSGALHTLVWDTSKDYIDNAESLNVQLRFMVNDGLYNSANGVSPLGFDVDNLAPQGLANFTLASNTDTTATVTWTAATDTNFAHYEIWYGTNLTDVQNRTGSAQEWDNTQDPNLANATATTTTITGLTANTRYYLKIWAVDTFGNEATPAGYVDMKVIRVTSPNGGETWMVGGTHNIEWTTSAGISNVRIELSTNEGVTFSTLESSTTNDGSHSWTIPDNPTTEARIRITATDDITATDMSDTNFTIRRSITITQPNGGKNIAILEDYEIRWTWSGNIQNVKVDYSVDGGTTFKTIITSTPCNGTYTWAVPNDPSTDAYIKVTSTANANVTDLSNAANTIIDVRIAEGTILCYPTPWKALTDPPVKMAFYLNENMPIRLFIYSIDGRIVHSNRINATEGYNEYTWDGATPFGGKVGNGIYIIKVIRTDEGGRSESILKGYIVVLD
ncbi:MAG: fibronectin type III domain-containing protein, partial [Candidatus Margulisbacteria bacterium]|nr:fibronectin type III domain-containing protein [Candidatus Margulisiibacteriota bacterium]MBU1955935.1 fibronectin type III domain-containing protein [Candidatus Margulisiibacteriota bacterium]